MFFKKNKPNPTPLDPNHPAAAQRDPMDAASLFAPGLNPSAQPIDFGFGRIPNPPNYAYPQSSPAAEVMPPVEPAENSGWAPQFEAPDAGFEAQQPMPELLNDAELFAAVPTAEGVAPLLESPMLSGAESSYLGEAFENYTPNPLTEPLSDSTENLGWDLPAEPAMNAELNTEFNTWDSGLETHSWTSEAPPGFAETVYPPSPSIEPQSDWAMPSEVALEPSLDSGMGDLMPWEQLPDNPTAQASPSPEALWEQFDAGATLPGEQVPMASGAFLDSVHEKLYPEDPFAPGYDELVEGQQAFEEAAQFLFPDTVSAPLDWQPEAYPTEGVDPFTAQALSLDNTALIEPPLELGPSVQSDVSEVSDMTAYAAEMLQAHLPQAQPSAAFQPAGESWLTDNPLEAFESFDSSATPSLSSPESFSLEGSSSTQADLTGFEFSNSGFESLPTGFETPETLVEGVSSQASLTSFDPLGPDALDFDPFNVPLTTAAESSGAGFNQFESSESVLELPVSGLEAPFQLPVDTWPSGERTPESAMGPSFVNSDALDFDPFTPLSTESASWETLESSTTSSGESGILWPGETNTDSEISEQGSSVQDASPAFQSWEMPASDFVQRDEALTAALPERSDLDAVGQPTLLELSDQDFYATDFTLNEFGELVPVESAATNVSLPLESPELPVEPLVTLDFAETPTLELTGLPEAPSASFEFSDAPLPESKESIEPPLAQEIDWFVDASNGTTQLFAEADAVETFQSPVEQVQTEAVSPFQQVTLPPIPIMPAPLPVEEEHVGEEQPPLTEFSGPLEAQWHDTSSEVTTSAIESSQVATPDEFLLSDIQILAVCPLFGDRRLLVVSSNGMHALMGQVGLQQPQIAVLKLFDHNPLAYQNSFTAVAEAHADSQGMFVTQVGTWRGIISTFQDKITLHTDLG